MRTLKEVMSQNEFFVYIDNLHDIQLKGREIKWNLLFSSSDAYLRTTQLCPFGSGMTHVTDEMDSDDEDVQHDTKPYTSFMKTNAYANLITKHFHHLYDSDPTTTYRTLTLQRLKEKLQIYEDPIIEGVNFRSKDFENKLKDVFIHDYIEEKYKYTYEKKAIDRLNVKQIKLENSNPLIISDVFQVPSLKNIIKHYYPSFFDSNGAIQELECSLPDTNSVFASFPHMKMKLTLDQCSDKGYVITLECRGNQLPLDKVMIVSSVSEMMKQVELYQRNNNVESIISIYKMCLLKTKDNIRILFCPKKGPGIIKYVALYIYFACEWIEQRKGSVNKKELERLFFIMMEFKAAGDYLPMKMVQKLNKTVGYQPHMYGTEDRTTVMSSFFRSVPVTFTESSSSTKTIVLPSNGFMIERLQVQDIEEYDFMKCPTKTDATYLSSMNQKLNEHIEYIRTHIDMLGHFESVYPIINDLLQGTFTKGGLMPFLDDADGSFFYCFGVSCIRSRCLEQIRSYQQDVVTLSDQITWSQQIMEVLQHKRTMDIDLEMIMEGVERYKKQFQHVLELTDIQRKEMKREDTIIDKYKRLKLRQLDASTWESLFASMRNDFMKIVSTSMSDPAFSFQLYSFLESKQKEYIAQQTIPRTLTVKKSPKRKLPNTNDIISSQPIKKEKQTNQQPLEQESQPNGNFIYNAFESVIRRLFFG